MLSSSLYLPEGISCKPSRSSSFDRCADGDLYPFFLVMNHHVCWLQMVASSIHLHSCWCCFSGTSIWWNPIDSLTLREDLWRTCYSSGDAMADISQVWVLLAGKAASLASVAEQQKLRVQAPATTFAGPQGYPKSHGKSPIYRSCPSENPWKSMKIYENPWKSMKIHENPWKSMKIHENPWKSMKIHENLWKSMKIHENPWKSMKIHENPWKSMKIHENLWKSMKIYENPWKSMKIYENLWKSMKIHENPWKSMKIYENPWKSMKIHENLWKSMKIHENPWKSMKIHENLWKSHVLQKASGFFWIMFGGQHPSWDP